MDQSGVPRSEAMDDLARAASRVGYEIVDIGGVLEMVEAQSQSQKEALTRLQNRTSQITDANSAVTAAAEDLTEGTQGASEIVTRSGQMVRDLGKQSREVASWVQELSDRSESVSETLKAVKKNNSQIASIAMEVNTLAINAKIEAARAGDAGRGFAVVAEAINELSRQTRDAADQISSNIETLTTWIADLGVEARSVSETATEVMSHSDATDIALGKTETAMDSTRTQVARIATEAKRVSDAIADVLPSMSQISAAITETSGGIEQATKRVNSLIDTSEAIVQGTASLGGMTENAAFIEQVQLIAQQISKSLDAAIADGKLSEMQVFDRHYVPIRGTNPEQYRTQYVDLFDQILPPIQEPALDFDPKVVFCAAVDVNGYLPTHNMKFARPPSSDPVWNAANCRNRRMFNDRVGLKAGRNTAPFLLQVYRRDMGGGDFVMMKDVSSPIRVNGRHWGGVRLAFTF